MYGFLPESVYCPHGYSVTTDLPTVSMGGGVVEETLTMQYPTPLIWIGTWPTPTGLMLDGFHVWNRAGEWIGVYPTHTKARAHA